MENVSGDARQRQIASTLMINTSPMMQAQSTAMEYNVSIQCILHQRVPPELNLQGGDDLIFSARLVVTPGKCDTFI